MGLVRGGVEEGVEDNTRGSGGLRAEQWEGPGRGLWNHVNTTLLNVYIYRTLEYTLSLHIKV